MLNARWIPSDDYVIGDEEYGYYLCRLSIYQEMREELSEDEIQKIAQGLARLVSAAIDDVNKE